MTTQKHADESETAAAIERLRRSIDEMRATNIKAREQLRALERKKSDELADEDS